MRRNCKVNRKLCNSTFTQMMGKERDDLRWHCSAMCSKIEELDVILTIL